MNGRARVDGARLRADLQALSRLGADPSGDGITRTGFSREDGLARDWYAGRVRASGLDLTEDGLGNTFAFDPDAEQTVPGVWSGSHLDTVPRGGAFDGAVGAVAALEVLRRVKELGLRPQRPLRAVVFSDEEGNYGSLLGSTGLCRGWSRAELEAMTGRDGDRLTDALAAWGHARGDRTATRLEPGALHAFVELHIEQGPVLERMGLPLGVVLGTKGVERHNITFHGQEAHSGSTPMNERRDALAAAAKLALEIRAIAKKHQDAVCTMGSVKTFPGIVTAVVGRCEVTLDQRDLDAAVLAQMYREAQEASQRFAQEEKCTVGWSRLWNIEPVPFHPQLLRLCQEAIRETAGRSHSMPSGPLHDAAEVCRAGIPTVMMFVQSLKGISHNKIEDTREEHLEMSVVALDRLASKTMDWIVKQR